MKTIIYGFIFLVSLSFVFGAITYDPVIPDITMDEDSVYDELMLDDYFEPSFLTYEIITNTTNVNITLDEEGGQNVIITPEEDWYGEFTFAISATDESASEDYVTDDITVTVEDVEDMPELIEDIPNQVLDINEDVTIDLSDYFKHGDGKDLDYYLSANLTNVDASFDDDEVTFSPELDWYGNESVTIVASDGDYETSSNEFIIEVRIKNMPPVISSYNPSQSIIELNVGESQLFTVSASDKNNNTLEYKWYIDDIALADQDAANYNYEAGEIGTYSIKVSVSDGSYSDTQKWDVIVKDTGEDIVTVTKEAVCGNGEIEEGENCGTCQEDAPCKEGYTCQNNACIFQEKKSNLTLILVVVFVFLIFAGLVFFFYSRKKKKEYGFHEKLVGEKFKAGKEILKDEPMDISKKTPKIKGQETSELDLYPKKVVVAEIKEKEIEKTVDGVMLRGYIRDNLNKGFSEEKIREMLTKKGWSKEKIDKAFKEYKY
ncbi:MAG: hypothetical protein PHE43_01305 [Candidatus Nanoarchaeia archaeon]|nr:hypothetical protein [Candidatus Nanoarchaeia archaeon]